MLTRFPRFTFLSWHRVLQALFVVVLLCVNLATLELCFPNVLSPCRSKLRLHTQKFIRVQFRSHKLKNNHYAWKISAGRRDWYTADRGLISSAWAAGGTRFLSAPSASPSLGSGPCTAPQQTAPACSTGSQCQ